MLHNVYYNGEMMSTKRYKRIKTFKTVKNAIMIVLFILLLGLIGHYDYIDAVNTSEYDRINKQEFIKDTQIKCLNGTLSKDDMYCKGM